MKKSFYFLLFNCALCTMHPALLHAQGALEKIWDYRYGGTDYDNFSCVIPTSDGGFILGGSSQSGIGGDKTEAAWGYTDYWIVKVDSLGIKQWDKNYGGTIRDVLVRIVPVSGGGYLLAGYSDSPISGDKTEDTWGNNDYWIVRIDNAGNKLWDKVYGGLSDDKLTDILPLPGGNFLLFGFSISQAGGLKTQPTNGNYDYWIIKIDAAGNILWDKDFGGSNYESSTVAINASDGGILLTGSSESGISGNKTDVCRGISDYWIVKIDSAGNFQWDKTMGSTNRDMVQSALVTSSGDYVLCGYSRSPAGGERSQPSFGDYDIWMVKTDASGTILWDKAFGGSHADMWGYISFASDSGFLITSDTFSPASGTKSQDNMGLEQTWLLKTDSQGNVLWEKTVLTNGHDENGHVIQLNDSCYVLFNGSNALSGGYKSQDPQGSLKDYWIVKFCETDELHANFFAGDGICPGSCTSLFNVSVNATGYQWYFPGGFPDSSFAFEPSGVCYSTPGMYDAQLVVFNSTGSDTLYLQDVLTVYPFPQPQSISQTGDTLFAVPGASYYQWYLNGTTIPGAVNYFHVAQASGDYTVFAYDTNDCYAMASLQNVFVSAGPDIFMPPESFVVYPNPVVDKLKIKNEVPMGIGIIMGTATVSIYNMFGELAVQLQTGNSKLETLIDVSELPPGIYYIQLNSGQQVVRTKFVKQ